MPRINKLHYFAKCENYVKKKLDQILRSLIINRGMKRG